MSRIKDMKKATELVKKKRQRCTKAKAVDGKAYCTYFKREPLAMDCYKCNKV